MYNLQMGSELADPCFPKGYSLEDGQVGRDVYKGKSHGSVQGTGDFEECRKRLRKVVLGGDGAICERGPCAMRGVYQPKFWLEDGGRDMIAIEHFR